MHNLVKALVGLAAIGFILAVVGTLTGWNFLDVVPEAYSRACTNLALLAIAVSLAFKDG